MRQRRLELWAHGLSVGFESLVAVLHLDELLGTGQDGWDGGDEADGLQVVRATADVRERGADAFDERGELELGGYGIEDVEAPGEREEGNGEMHLRSQSAWGCAMVVQEMDSPVAG